MTKHDQPCKLKQLAEMANDSILKLLTFNLNFHIFCVKRFALYDKKI